MVKWANKNTNGLCARETKLKSRMEKLETRVDEIKKSQPNTYNITPIATYRASEPKIPSLQGL